MVEVINKKVILMEKDKCKRCGECCRYLRFRVEGIGKDKDQLEYWNARGCTIEGDVIVIPFVCPHLKNNLCDIHETKPKLCKQFRGQKESNFYVPKNCGYNNDN